MDPTACCLVAVSIVFRFCRPIGSRMVNLKTVLHWKIELKKQRACSSSTSKSKSRRKVLSCNTCKEHSEKFVVTLC